MVQVEVLGGGLVVLFAWAVLGSLSLARALSLSAWLLRRLRQCVSSSLLELRQRAGVGHASEL